MNFHSIPICWWLNLYFPWQWHNDTRVITGQGEHQFGFQSWTKMRCIFGKITGTYGKLVGGLEHLDDFSISYMGCHPSHWRSHIFQDCFFNHQPDLLRSLWERAHGVVIKDAIPIFSFWGGVWLLGFDEMDGKTQSQSDGILNISPGYHHST